MLAWGAAGRHYHQTWRANGGLWTIRTNNEGGGGFSSLYYLHGCGHRRNRHRFVSPFMGFLSTASHSPAVRINAADPIRGFRSHAECQHGHHTQQEVNSGIVGLIRQTPLCELASPSISDTPDRWRWSAAGHSSEKHGGTPARHQNIKQIQALLRGTEQDVPLEPSRSFKVLSHCSR